jgi:tetratricopeptide (TPR) repeat protein
MITLLLASMLVLTTTQDDAPIQLAPATQFQTPEVRLAERLDALAEADAVAAVQLVDEIRALWNNSGSDTTSLLMDRGRVAEAAGSPEIAARMFDHVTARSPEFAEGWLAAGRIAAAMEDWPYALETLNTALTIEPRRFDAYMTIGAVLESAGEIEAALRAYQQALEIYPAFEAALIAQARLTEALSRQAL